MSASPSAFPRLARVLLVAGGTAGLLVAGACANAPGLVILQNQIPSVEMTSGNCVVSTDLTVSNPGPGVFDVAMDHPRPYFVYPMIQSRLPSITTGGIERNTISVHAVRATIKAPPGFDPGWAADCPASTDWPQAAALDPAQSRALIAQGFQPCHATRLADLIGTQPIFFTIELTAVADRYGDTLLSAPFPFGVQVCAGCLQSMFPNTPTCASAPNPNPFLGNPCNIAQDGPAVLCCTDAQGGLVCPAPGG